MTGVLFNVAIAKGHVQIPASYRAISTMKEATWSAYRLDGSQDTVVLVYDHNQAPSVGAVIIIDNVRNDTDAQKLCCALAETNPVLEQHGCLILPPWSLHVWSDVRKVAYDLRVRSF